MGVPKFYRWISERYPCLSEVVKDYQIPEFDNLYLDMNGIIHVCSHPEDDNPHFRITEEKIFQDIFHYIEVLFRMIKPRKVFFMAVDGVAPRAKMNQQRGRRFRSAREAEMLVRKALEKGETLPSEERFDSNCITPGTEFMSKLQEQLKFFVVNKISSDQHWQGPKIYLSGHETPGEGEHKVMDFIRYEKSQPDYDPNTRHCLYGLDADLMMLGLSSHEPHFSLLREEVRFGGKNSQKQKRSTAPEETTFHLLHLTLFREYLDYEFAELKDKVPFGYDLERIIDDWILMGFLVGNDFIPHLPNMHIHHDALPTLWKYYKEVLPTLDGYLHDGGTLNLPRFEKFMAKLSEVDFDAFADKFSDLKWLEAKSESKAAKDEANIRQRASVSSNDVGIPTANEFIALRNVTDDGEDEDLRAEMGAMTLEEFEDIEDDFMVDENAMLEKEFRSHKDAYYLNKMSLTASSLVLQNQAEQYVRAIQWILHYYFNGVPSWSWYYPYHYAPYLSDVCNFANMKMNFNISKPFLTFQQLMAVLPSASKNIMPKPLQSLMVEENSPVIDFYPADFELDLNGKMQEWEAVVLIPFIAEERLLNAMAPLEDKLTDEEKARNKHGPHTLFCYDPAPQGIYQSSMIDKYPDSTVYNCHARICTIHQDLFRIPPEKIYKGLCKGVSLEVYYPGFPTLKHLPHTAKLSKAGVKVFQQNSRGQNTMLTLTNTVDKDIEEVAKEYLGRSIYVSWPHMIEARVVAVADGTFKYSLLGNNQRDQQDSKDIQRLHMDQDESKKWAREVASIEGMYHDRKGVVIGDTSIIVYATPMTGRKYVYNTSITLEKQWSSVPVAYALQATAKDIAVKDPVYRQYKTLEELFTPKTRVFMLGQPHYGCMGEILDVDQSNEGRVRVNFTKPDEPNLESLIRQNEYADKYMPGYIIAQKVGMSGFLVSRFTGVLYISKGSKAHPPARDTNRTNVALNLKYNKTNMEVPGFTKKSDVDNQWLYSTRVLQILLEYTRKFPELFDYISSCSDETFYEDDIFGEDSSDKVKELREYLKNLSSTEVAPAEQGTRIVHKEVVEGIQKAVERALSNNKRKRIKMQVKPHLLYRSLYAQANSVPDPTTTYQLFDRVVNVREGYSVPLGQRGTVIGIRAAAKEQDVLYEVLFDEEFMGGLRIRCKVNKAYRVPATALINLTHGERKEEAKNSFKPTAVVKPQQGKTEGFKPAWMLQPKTGGGNQWNQQPQQQAQQPYQPPSAQQGYPRDQQTQPSSRAALSSTQQGHPLHERGNQQFYSSNQQMRGGSHQQQWRGGNGGPNTMQTHGYQGGYGSSHQGYNNSKQSSGMASGGSSNSQQSSGRQTYHRMQHQHHQHPPPFNQNTTGRKEEKPGYSNEEDPFVSTWKQLQGSTPQTWRDKDSSGNRNPHNRQPTQSHQSYQQQQQPNERQVVPSLTDAAKVLKESQFSATPKNANNNRTVGNRSLSDHHSSAANASSSQPSHIQSQPIPNLSSQPVDINQLINKKPEGDTDKEDFNRLMAALHPNAGSSASKQSPGTAQPKSTAQEGTEALQQLLKVQGNSEPSSSSQSSSGTQQPYGKQVSVQDLFQGAKGSVLDGNQRVKEGSAPKVRLPKQNPVGALLDYCKSRGLLAPRYDYKYGRDNKLCCVVTMPDGEQFKGSYTKDRQTAMDSAANIALNSLNLSGSSIVPGIFLDQRKSEDTADGNFAMSPNSAFTAVRGTGPMGMEFSFTGSSNRYGDPFPKPPVQPQFPAPQQGQLHTRQSQSDQYYHGNTDPQRHPGHHSYQQQQHHQHHQKNYQGYSSHSLPGSYQQYRGQQGQHTAERYENDHEGAKEFQEHGKRDHEKGRDNPFVPLQVFKKQKTPVKSEDRDWRNHTNSDDRDWRKPPNTDNRDWRNQTNSRNPQETATGSIQVGSTEEKDNPFTPGATAPPSKRHNQRADSKKGKWSSGSQKEGSANGERGPKSQPKRPRSRIAAKFT